VAVDRDLVPLGGKAQSEDDIGALLFSHHNKAVFIRKIHFGGVRRL
jgi:hypothetical protein